MRRCLARLPIDRATARHVERVRARLASELAAATGQTPQAWAERLNAALDPKP